MRRKVEIWIEDAIGFEVLSVTMWVKTLVEGTVIGWVEDARVFGF